MSRTDNIVDAMKQINNIRNIAICAHIDHGKTTFCDGLLAGAGMMSEELAGTSRQLDYRADEIERGITIDAAATSMLFKNQENQDGKNADLLVNLIDTPGHIDFGGDVTRAMRAVDGCIILVDAVEGVMPQTETVLRQALREYVKPILFINKVDRLIRELKINPQEMQAKFTNIIDSVNKLIIAFAPAQFSKSWQVSVEGGSVLFGSAVHNWALSLAVIKDKSVSLNQIIDIYNSGDEQIKKLRKIVSLHECVVQAVESHLPSPKVSAKYRIPLLWHGDINSEIGKALLACDSKGPPVFVVTKIELENNAEIITGRIYCGTLSRGDELIALRKNTKHKISQLFVRNGAKKEQIEKAFAGNIISISGLDVCVGETLALEHFIPFEEISHLFEPVITKAIEPQRAVDLPQLETVLAQMQKEDPGLVVDINKETGEYLICGYGELHLEIIENRIRDVKKLAVRTSPPLIVYREEIAKSATSEQTSSLDNSAVKVTANHLEADELAVSLKVDAENKFTFRGNLLFGKEKLTHSLIDAFCDIMRRGPLAGEPCHSIKINIEKIVGENPGVVYPLFKEAVRQAIISAQLQLLEPIQELQIDGPSTQMGDITTLVASRKGDIIDVIQSDDGERVSILATIPVSQTIGMTGDLRACTNGRGSISIRKQFFTKMNDKEQARLVRILREKKGLF